MEKTMNENVVDMKQVSTPSQVNKNKCKARTAFVDAGNGMFMVGHKFMSKYYTIFDRQNDRVGIASSIDNEH